MQRSWKHWITIITTAIPTMAQDFDINPINLKLALTSYLISIALFIPISGWVADSGGRSELLFSLWRYLQPVRWHVEWPRI